MAGRRWVGLLFGGLGALALSSLANAQLSPGQLSESHAAMEGSAHCLECHSSGKGVDPELCLGCHALLRDRIERGRGLHARADYVDCKSCHIDHHGREFELVWWGEAGIDAFDHGLTGHPLAGRHAELGCRDCHRRELNPAVESLEGAGKDPGRSFLGLSTQCLSCHLDEHRGQFDADRCSSCHTEDAWAPASRFDHADSAFPLTGLHRSVTCEGCHVAVEEPAAEDADFLRFVGVAFAKCAACHADPHAGRLGTGCEGCHTTAGWGRIDSSGFDHDLTRYALRGRHRSVTCDACHPAGASKRRTAFGSCTDCHSDEHAGQFEARADGGRCESCHSVEGFKPSSFTIQEHAPLFALDGAHRTVACEACHRRPAADTSAGLRAPMQFRFESAECEDCHADPHAATAVGRAPTGGEAELACRSCHVTAAWSDTSFDHVVAGFELSGPHLALGCAECHGRDGSRRGATGLDFSGLDVGCVSCHEDRHQGQFADGGGVTECQRCHRVESWIPAAEFEHSSGAAFALEGAHSRVPCESCHRTERTGTTEFIRYRPLARRCVDCHGG